MHYYPIGYLTTTGVLLDLIAQLRCLTTEELIKLNVAPESIKVNSFASPIPSVIANLQSNITNSTYSTQTISALHHLPGGLVSFLALEPI